MDADTLIIGTDISPKIAATAVLSQNGFSITDQAKAFEISPRQISNRIRQLPPSLRIDSKKRVKLASKVIDLTLQGQPVGQVEKVTATTVLNAALAVYDRAQPIRQDPLIQQSFNSFDISPSLSSVLDKISSVMVGIKMQDSRDEGGNQGGQSLDNKRSDNDSQNI